MTPQVHRIAAVVARVIIAALGTIVFLLFIPPPRAGAQNLALFPPSASGAYRIEAPDAYRWAEPFAIAEVRQATEAVLREFGPSARPLEIADCSQEDGATPKGRHPSGAHDSGLNLDLTYYRTAVAPDYSVFALVEDGHGAGSPVYLDAEREAAFLIALAAADRRAPSGHRRLQRIAVDGRILPVLQAAIRARSEPDAARALALIYGEREDLGTGWFRFHFNHCHVRFAP